MTNIQRNPTIPMTKRDSLLSNGTRVSLLANGSSTTPKKFEEKDYVNTNPNMVAGKKRSPKLNKVKRTSSYKIATNRQSTDDLDGLSALGSSANTTRGPQGVRTVDRTKYNTLPRTETVVPQKKPVELGRRKREAKAPRSDFERTASQKSGTYPSPDTDEDQRSIQPDRKKKSTFKRMKERLILTFRKNRDHEKHKGNGSKYKGPTGRVKPNQSSSRDAFKTPNVDIEVIEDNNNDDHKSGVTNSGFSKPNKGPGFLKTLRNSFRIKAAPSKYKKNQEKESSGEPHSSPSLPSSLERDQTVPTATHVQTIEEDFMEADDSITELFGSLIDPEGRTSDNATSNFQKGPRPDTSKFRLEGLKKFKPRSFDRNSPSTDGHHARGAHGSDLSPTVEIDGLDYADAPPCVRCVEESEVEFAEISEHEQQRRVDDVAKRLAAIGDSIAGRIESESAGSSEEVEGFRVGNQPRRRSELEEELLRELRRFGDQIDGTLMARSQNRVQFSSVVLPIICKIIRSQDYSTFREVVQREISNTVGWEQVAWYTYLMKATMDIAGAGKTAGRIMKTHATRYFSSTLKPWIQRQPNGWESLHEETDTECEVD
ncbi:uncharacterized protein LOC132730956 isoform X2 [Ruditapes philippinarum]|nr:uncharacterized protein LOC132730956 isoform X2 [Ruditapes philippinarum]XP_060573041.1 uncharacterized protein LOC132730956 isoform X2 [Ruditapes philippinarum]